MARMVTHVMRQCTRDLMLVYTLSFQLVSIAKITVHHAVCCVQGFASLRTKLDIRHTHTSSQSVWADMFLATVSHRLVVLFSIFVFITVLLTRLDSQNIPSWKRCLLFKQYLFPFADWVYCMYTFMCIYVHLSAHIWWPTCISPVFMQVTLWIVALSKKPSTKPKSLWKHLGKVQAASPVPLP